MVITYLGNDVFKVQFGEATLTFGEDLKVKKGTNPPFIITGPGEYEVGGVFIKGFPGDIYTINLENMNVCFMNTIPESINEDLEEVDILFVNVADAGKAYKLAVSLEPSIVIPTRYSDAQLKAFLKEAGSAVKSEQKLTLKRKDLEGKKAEVVVLESVKE